MALFTPSESPAVVVKEIDLTGGVPNVQSTTGAIVGNFRWGPMDQRVPISNETELVNTFATPNTTNNVDFLSTTQFLRYSSSMQVVRMDYDSATNAVMLSNGTSIGALATPGDLSTGIKVKNSTEFNNVQSNISSLTDSSTTVNILFSAKYPGQLGNSLKVSYVGGQDSAAQPQFDAWDYATAFNEAPGTSTFGRRNLAWNDEMHLVVVDEDGQFTGTRGTILEKFENLSMIPGAKRSDGTNIYAMDVINQNSQYVWMNNFDSDFRAVGAGSSFEATGVDQFFTITDSAHSISAFSGQDPTTVGVTNYLNGYDLFEDKDQVEIDFLIAPGLSSDADQVTIVNDLVATAQGIRKDCVVAASPYRSGIVGVTSDATKVTNTITNVNKFTRSSYLVVDNNYLKVYDKYNDIYVDIPAASTVAGIMAATDYNRAPWFSPAGSRRGQLLGVTSLNYSPTKAQRDTLYKAGVNPIANIPGQGTLLFGDKTFLTRASAFDRINVRRLFLVLERAIGKAAEQVLFEFNDEFTRAEFVNIVEPVLREIKGRRGITDFRVVADETNNTAEVIDRNEFIASIFIKPARSINYVTLNFVAVRTGVDFEEVVGTV